MTEPVATDPAGCSTLKCAQVRALNVPDHVCPAGPSDPGCYAPNVSTWAADFAATRRHLAVRVRLEE